MAGVEKLMTVTSGYSISNGSLVSDFSQRPNSNESAIKEQLIKCKSSFRVEGFPYRGGTFAGTLLEGKPFEGEVKNVDILYKRFDGHVKDGALAYSDRTRLQRPGTTTPFQKMLREVNTPFQRLEKGASFLREDDAVRRMMLNCESQYTKLDTNEKFDVTNDNQRRFFDTCFSKEMLTSIVSSDVKMAAIRKLSDCIIAFYKSDILTDKFSDWESACKGSYCGEDARFQQLVTQNDRARDAIEGLEINGDAKKLLLDLYQRRYLNYLVDETDAYKDDHPVGIVKSKTNPLYFKRGRLDGDFGRVSSMNVGILRSIDKSPVDFRFSTVPDKKTGISPELYTRCPDRLNMADPSGAVDSDPDSWLTYNFLSGNTPFVNGLSGSMLIEIRGMLYLKERLDSGNFHEHFLKSADMVDVLNDYFSVVSGLYVYVDGGHSLFEIQSSFKQTWVKGAFISTFEGREWGDVGQDLYSDVEVFAKAYHATKLFDGVLQNQQAVNGQLNYIDPSTQSALQSRTMDLAMKQSVEGRRVLYSPSDILLKELGAAANVLHQVMINLSPDSQAEISAHLLGKGRLMDGKSTRDLIEVLQRVSIGETSPELESASATDRAVVIALMGDIGGFYTTPVNATEELVEELNLQLTSLGLYVPSGLDIKVMKDAGGSGAVGPDKRAERKISPKSDLENLPLRAGVHNTGREADNVLNISPGNRIPENRWTVFNVSTPRVKETVEPFVGHMSASPAEILQAWDMLRGEKGENQYVGTLASSSTFQKDQEFVHPMSGITSSEQAQRYARAAGASAFLLGLGYHSAVEVLEGTLGYTGQSIRTEGVLSQSQRDAADLFGQGAATDLIMELFREYSLPQK
ncbi:hypothetical protein D3C71_375760 [compost metagenome]